MFFPWVGANYPKGGIFKKKILILGESHYCYDLKGCTDAGQAIKMINPVWNSVVFYNYVQTKVTGKARVRPTQQMYSISEESFEDVMDKLEPE